MTLSDRWTAPLLTWLGAFACLMAGAAVAERGRLALLVLAGIAGLAILVIFEQVGIGVLLAWIVLSGPLFPLLSTGATNTNLSFDRLVIVGMATWLLTRRGEGQWSPTVKHLAWALAWLALAYGVRAALTTPAGPLSVTGGDARLDALNTWLDAIVLPVLLFLIVTRYVTTPHRIDQVLGAMAVAGAVLGFIGIVVKVGGFDLSSASGGESRVDDLVHVVRVAGPYNVPETYALVLLMCLAAAVWWTYEHFREAAPFGLTAIALILAGIGVTLFRAALLGALLIAVAGIGLRPGRAFRLIGATLVTAGVVWLAIGQLQENRVITERLQNTENINGRFATYRQGVALFEERPLVGVGVGQFANAQKSVAVTVVGGVEAVTSPHSSLVAVVAEQGIVGTLPLLACVVAAWFLLADLRRRARRRSDVILWSCLVGAALAYLIMSLTLTMLPYGPSNAFFALLLGLGAARVNSLYAENRAERS